MYKERFIQQHLTKHATIYVFMIILFLTGIIFGAILVNSMDFVQRQDLFFYLERFFGQIADNQSIERNEILFSSFSYHLKYLLFLFILGLSVIGLPIVWILLFTKGLVVGFSVGFFVNQLGGNGLLLATFSIAPQNLVIIPIYIIAGSLAMIFSLTLLNKLFAKKISEPIFQPFSKYVFIFALLVLCAFAASLLETFVANQTMEWFIRSYYQ